MSGSGIPNYEELDRRARDAEAIRRKADPNRPVRVFADGVWDPVQKRMVPDTVGTLVYPADYVYDPMRGGE